MPVPHTSRFLLLYASQTSQAESISELIYDNAVASGLSVERHCLSSTDDKFKIEDESSVVFVVSTTGDGDVPDTAVRFLRKLKKKSKQEEHLKHLSYTVLGLGDTNYNAFCNGGKTINRKLEELGAHLFYECGWADDAVGLELVVEPWIEGLWKPLKAQLESCTTSKKMEQSTETNSSPSETPPTENEAQKLTETDKMTLPTDSLKEQILRNPLLNNLMQDIPLGVKIVEKTPHSNYIMDLADRPVDVSNVELVVQTDLTEEKHQAKESASLTCCAPHLKDSDLSIPLLSPPYLVLTLLPDEKLDLYNSAVQNGASFPSMASSVQTATVLKCSCLTHPGAVKTTLDLELFFEDTETVAYQPGDSISVICPNNEREVNHLIQRLDLENAGDAFFSLSVSPNTTKKKASCPNYLPPKCTIRYALTHCLDIREPPKKALLRMLVDYASDEQEKRRLQELCSKEGMSEYTTYIREPGLSLLDILLNFPSVMPPFERILELLPRLQPRPYSVASSQETDKNKLHIVFNVVQIPAGRGRRYHRQGVCTGWLEQLTLSLQSDSKTDQKDLPVSLSSLSLAEKPIISFFTRTNQRFHLPSDSKTPLIMIGPGTGIAPFIGFLQHRHHLSKTQPLSDAWLFYGCRHQKKDFLYQDEIEKFLEQGCLSKFFVSFSRDEQPEESPRYVQDNLQRNSKELVDLLDKDAIVYVCGDAKNMAKDVCAAFTSILASEKGVSPEEANKILMKLRLDKRYLEDIWT
ncbi:methionine synthase reductase isoform X1 [Octopus bimaculoides]|uniref:Methionine synthase reductase n=2 Tax=Octopus bimaculoides TaxID=37653 RepID=A0A0L8FP11_OCTBM|nr:methionine synthase reductase isoform X1 [Octopus bimaculoides]|eukprot:XP_014788148.1 PREDICTED: methionine synthase reductase-like isoform X1 [Octopus bimaculoides]